MWKRSLDAVRLAQFTSSNMKKKTVETLLSKNERRVGRSKTSQEAAILNTVKGHRNLSEFLRFCTEPYAIMMEQACFDFTPLGVPKQVNTLEDFLHFVDAEFDFTSFSDVLVLCARDIVTGLEYLHKNDIAHDIDIPGQ